jgi:hypothetical protein
VLCDVLFLFPFCVNMFYLDRVDGDRIA